MWNFLFDFVEAMAIAWPYIVAASIASWGWTWLLTGWLGER